MNKFQNIPMLSRVQYVSAFVRIIFVCKASVDYPISLGLIKLIESFRPRIYPLFCRQLRDQKKCWRLGILNLFVLKPFILKIPVNILSLC